jgi:hypothetical protein
LLITLQIIGGLIFIWRELPSFRQVSLNPGVQLPYTPYDDLTVFGAVLAMQAAYWYRLKRVPVPVLRSSIAFNHLLLFSGRISFIFGAALFSLIFFPHLPELGRRWQAPCRGIAQNDIAAAARASGAGRRQPCTGRRRPNPALTAFYPVQIDWNNALLALASSNVTRFGGF